MFTMDTQGEHIILKKQMKKKCGNKLFNIINDKINKPCKNTFTRLLFLFGGKNEIQRMAHNMA